MRRATSVVESSVGVGLAASTEPDLVPAVVTDGRCGTELNRFKFLAGRPVRPVRSDRPDEVMVSFLLARARHLHVGGVLTVHFRTTSQVSPVAFRGVGIQATAGEFPPLLQGFSGVAYL